MLESLISYLNGSDSDLEDDPLVVLDSVEFVDWDAKLKLSVWDTMGEDKRTLWIVHAVSVFDFEVKEPQGDLALKTDHVLARQHTDLQQDLSFRSVPRSASEVIGQLYLAHLSCAGDQIPFRRYLNTHAELKSLLAKGFGKLAEGPSFLMEAYAEVLRNTDISPSLLPPRSAKTWRGDQFVSNPSKLATLLIGDSFVVAEDFQSTRIV